MDSSEPSNLSNGQPSAEELNVEILPLIYEILRGIERESSEIAQKPRESQDTSLKVLELHKKLNQVRDQIKKLPGIDYNRTDQLKQLDTLRKQLRLKRELLLKYRNMCSFEIPKVMILRYLANNEELVYKLSESKPVRRAAQLTVSLYHRSKMQGAEFEKSAAGRRMTKYLERLANKLKAINEGQKPPHNQ